jgi:predicted glycosyl hydrolase (DUF1957 family)
MERTFMKYINLFFHIYQPPTQDDKVLGQIVQESYGPLTRQFLEFQDLKFTLNINYSLVELLHNDGFPEILTNIRKAHDSGNLELTATGAYHPIFPLIPEEEVKKQLDINDVGIKRLLTPSFKPEGVFPPEMAFEGNLVSLFKDMGYKWTITDDSNLSYYADEIPYNKIYSFEGLAVFLRSNGWTNKFANYHDQWQSGKDAVDELKISIDQWMGTDDGYLIIALDGETFGHHHPELGETFLIELFTAFRDARNNLQLAHLSEIYDRFPRVPVFIPPGSWSTDRENVRERDYFSWWKSNRNRIHTLQWEFTDFVLSRVRKLNDEKINAEMDRALYSCQYWWASFWKFNPGEIYRGAFNMMRILQDTADLFNDYEGIKGYEGIKDGEKIFRDLVTEIEKKQHGWEN